MSGYGQLADTALARFGQIANGNTLSFPYAYAASASGLRNGWGSDLTAQYLAEVRQRALWNNDGSLKGWPASATTTVSYTITLADHVGPVLLEAYENGAGSPAEVLRVASLLAGGQKWASVGQCMSYLTLSLVKDCVHNANAATALFLENVRAAGLEVPGVGDLVPAIIRQETYRYNSAARAWPYSDTQTGIQDADHGSLSADAGMTLFPPIGRQAVEKLMTTAYSGAAEVNSPLGHLRAGRFDCARTGNWLAEAQAYQAATANDAMRQAQIARWAAKIAEVCG